MQIREAKRTFVRKICKENRTGGWRREGKGEVVGTK